MGAQRRVAISEDDIIVFGGYELSASVLKSIIEPDRRLLWAFVKAEGDRAIQPVAYGEDRILWLLPEDLERTRDEVQDLCKE
jgi:hypothetical protein